MQIIKTFISKTATLLASLVIVFSFQTKAQTGNDAALECLGSLGGTCLYDTYVIIGTLGDSYEKKVYEKDYMIQVIDEQVAVLKTNREMLTKLVSSGFLTDPADKTFVNDMNSCSELLETQATALKTYVNDPVVANSDKFQASRDAAWAKVSDLLGIKDTDDK